MIWCMQYKRLKLFKLKWFGAKALFMGLTYILSLISSLKEKKDTSYKSQVQPRKKKGLNMYKWETQNLWIVKSLSKGEMSNSWTWNTSNECYGES